MSMLQYYYSDGHYIPSLLAADPPTLMEVKDVGVPVGQQAILGCEAEAEPAANFEWYKDNER